MHRVQIWSLYAKGTAPFSRTMLPGITVKQSKRTTILLWIGTFLIVSAGGLLVFLVIAGDSAPVRSLRIEMETMIAYSLILGATMLVGFVMVLFAIVSMIVDGKRKPPRSRTP